MGGRLERARGLNQFFEPTNVLDDDPKTVWSSEMNAKFPNEIVLAFPGRDTALVSGVTLTLPQPGINPTAGICPDDRSVWAKDVEIWTSLESPTAGFSRVMTTTLPMEPGAHPVSFTAPVEARYVKIAIVSNHGCARFTVLADISVREAQAPGYVPLLTRHADLASLLSTGTLPPVDGPRPPPPSGPATATPGDVCAAPAPAQASPVHPESRNVLVVGNDPELYGPYYYAKSDPESPSIRYFPSGPGEGRVDSSIVRRLAFWAVPSAAAYPAALVPSAKIDTVVLTQICDLKTSLSDSFKRALVNWVTAGNKLIIQDSDRCGGSQPDYSFLPFAFATSNPGARGAPSRLTFVENSFLASGDPNDPAYLDEESWRLSKNGNFGNDLGDSNTVTKYDSHWCGALAAANVNGERGFVFAYASHGRGLILYDGIDYDQRRNVAYRQYVLRQLLLPFDPDGLPCSVPLAPFVVTTDASLIRRDVSPGRTYTYPLAIFPNLGGYQGAVRLSLSSSPAPAGLVARFEPESVTLGAEAKSTLTLTLPATLPDSWRIAVHGEATGANATLCLAANLRRTSTLSVISDLGAQPATLARKNLLVILDLSGSMNLPLAKSTRIATARQVLRDVLKRVPDDFNVGLRLYGHRYGSRQKETCTDSELVIPVRPLNRDAILKVVDTTRPKGETPLVYSVLQAVADLKGAGGGSVVLITDGEESCGGDFAKATNDLRQSGVALRLNIVGFTLKGQQARQQLGSLAASTGGSYYAAEDGPALTRALVAATISRFPYSVLSASGATIGKGEAGDKGLELPPGDYRVVVDAGGEQLVIDRIAVAAGRDATVRVVRQRDRFALER